MKKNSTGLKDRKQVKEAGARAASEAGGKRQPQITLGLDLGDKTSRCCAIGEDGEVLFERSIATTKKGMAQVFGALARCRIALEVGTHSPWVSRLLKSFGYEVIVANARQVKLITQSSRKNDKLDAHTLARLARVDPQLLKPIQHRSEEAQQHLMVIRVRAALVETRTALINSARGLAKAVGERLPKCDADSLELERLEALPAGLQPVLQPLLEEVESLTEKKLCLSNSANWRGADWTFDAGMGSRARAAWERLALVSPVEAVMPHLPASAALLFSVLAAVPC